MIQSGDDFRIALEALAQFRAFGEMSRKNLDGNDAIETCITGFVHRSHSTGTNSGKDFVGPGMVGRNAERHTRYLSQFFITPHALPIVGEFIRNHYCKVVVVSVQIGSTRVQTDQLE
jgi:hypothetical protein